jgi:hypothetical protein
MAQSVKGVEKGVRKGDVCAADVVRDLSADHEHNLTQYVTVCVATWQPSGSRRPSRPSAWRCARHRQASSLALRPCVPHGFGLDDACAQRCFLQLRDGRQMLFKN